MNSEAWDALKSIVPILTAVRPDVGRHVSVEMGKHHGKTGVVFWHGRDAYVNPFRYADDFQAQMITIKGVYGYRVGIETAEGEKIFVKADQVVVFEPIR